MYLWNRELPDGGWIDVIPLTFGRARIGIRGPDVAPGIPDDYRDVW
jgi:hypothetical protein